VADAIFPVQVREESASAVDGELDVTIVLPIYNENGHLKQEIERIQVQLRDHRGG
jgi:hypothetical protein